MINSNSTIKIMQHEISADPKFQTTKPSGNEAGRISQRLQPADVPTISDFAEDIGKGRSWGPVRYNGPRKNTNFVSQSVFALDFDSGITPEQSIRRLQSYEITPNLWYPTFGDSPEKCKFRLVLFLDTVITDLAARNRLMDDLLQMYLEADQSCSDAARFFYGTNKKVEVLTNKVISLEHLISALDTDKIKGGGRMRKLDVKDAGVRQLRGYGELKAPYNKSIGGLQNTMSYEQKEEAVEKLRLNLRDKKVDWKKLQARVKVFHDFMNSDTRLKYGQLLGLAQNMAWMNGGRKVFENRLDEFNDNHNGNNPYPRDGRFELMRSMHKYNKTVKGAYFPQRLENFSPYPADHQYRNLIKAERDLINGIELIQPVQRMTLKKAESALQYKLDEALDSLENKIYVFKCATGIGKSWGIKDIDSDVVLGFPTNQLKRDIFDEREFPTTAAMTPELPTFKSEKLNQKMQRLYKAGLGKTAHRLLWDIKKGRYGMGEDQYKARAYLDDNKAAKNSGGAIFTTHNRAIFSSFKYSSCYIFDEDPLNILLNVDTLKISDLKKIEKHANPFGFRETSIFNLQRYLEDAPEDEIRRLPDKFEVDIERQSTSLMEVEGLESNIVEFLDCAYFYKDPRDRDLIHFINRNELPKDKKIIILSATIPIWIYRKLYGERLEVIDLSNIRLKGKVVQHAKYSFSRNSLNRHLEEANKQTASKPTITFKSFGDSIGTASDKMHFGNCSGYNDYKGKDINVLGCPHRANPQYFLMGKELGANVDKYNRQIRMQTVTTENFRFSFNTFDNEDLRQIQLSLIESELIQAVGRARALREDSRVDVYANFPLPIASSIEWGKGPGITPGDAPTNNQQV